MTNTSKSQLATWAQILLEDAYRLVMVNFHDCAAGLTIRTPSSIHITEFRNILRSRLYLEDREEGITPRFVL